MLLAAGRRGADGANFTGMVDEALASMGLKVEDLVATTAAPELTEMLIRHRAELAEVRPFLLQLEDELRDVYSAAAEDDVEDTTTADAPPPEPYAITEPGDTKGETG